MVGAPMRWPPTSDDRDNTRRIEAQMDRIDLGFPAVDRRLDWLDLALVPAGFVPIAALPFSSAS